MVSRAVSALKLWLILHFTAWACSCAGEELLNGTIPNDTLVVRIGVPALGAPTWDTEDKLRTELFQRRYFYEHNETQIAMAREDARGISDVITSSSTLLFPEISLLEDGCGIESAQRDLEYNVWSSRQPHGEVGLYSILPLAVDSCVRNPEVDLGSQDFEFCSQTWVKPEKPSEGTPTRSFKVLAKISVVAVSTFTDILAEGLYFPATGKMHLVGCTREQRPTTTDTTPVMFTTWEDPGLRRFPPLNSSSPQDCAIVVTLQYPPLDARWNSDRVLKYSISSKRENGDALYFDPVEGSAFHPYLQRRFEFRGIAGEVQLQRRLETGARIVLLVLGLVCVALQIEHGRSGNDEALPFVSLVMLGIQLAHHFSQTSVFKDLQIGTYRGDALLNGTSSEWFRRDAFPESSASDQFNDYARLAWIEHVPYQAMAMTAIFMYIWIFHRVGDRRRIMSLRVRQGKPGARDAPNEWRVLYATLTSFSLLCFLGFLAFSVFSDQHGHIRRALTRMSLQDEDLSRTQRVAEDALYPGLLAPSSAFVETPPFVSWRFYEHAQARWGFVNKLTELVVSLFLVPQLLGNVQWEVRGRPLSAWFYVGIPLLQSLPHVFSISKHFELLPIFSFYDPYLNSVYGMYDDAIDLWWKIGVVMGSAVQVLVVHAQFSYCSASSPYSRPRRSAHVQMVEML